MQEHYIRSLPATTITCHVIQRASSLARKVGARAMLSGCAIGQRCGFLLLLSCEMAFAAAMIPPPPNTESRVLLSRNIAISRDCRGSRLRR